MAGSATIEPVRRRNVAPRLPVRLAAVVRAHFPDEARAVTLTGSFLATPRFDRALVGALVQVGRGAGGASWNLRLLAATMVASQGLRLSAEGSEDLTWLLETLGLRRAGDETLNSDLRMLGYTSADPAGFAAEFRRHLRRLDRVHRRLDGLRTTEEAFEELILDSRIPCKAVLARHLFTPAEVAARIVREVEVSSGMPAFLEDRAEHEARRYFSRLPAYEREIVRLLCQHADVYWSCDRTGSTINGLVEKPIGTVVCVVKPPGSTVELELKRTGIGGAFPLGAVYRGVNGNLVPPSHRLQGGASAASLRWESSHAAILAEVWRIAHGGEAPISKALALATYQTVPCDGGEVHLLDYFTDPAVFGPRFAKMRREMLQCVEAFDEQLDREFAHLPGDAGLTGRFLYHVVPCQGLLAETTSFRLDKLAGYFSPTGAELYFREGLKRARHSRAEARSFAEALLEEVLGVCVPPGAPYEEHEQYLAAAFAVPENRRRADRRHAAAVSALGMLWGTILALGGYTNGESFVGRNVGLKSTFSQGEWTARLIAMDHDNLHLPSEYEDGFWAQGALSMSETDEAFLRGNPGRPYQVERSSLHYLRRIYRIEGAEAPAASSRCLETAMALAARQTRKALASDPRMGRVIPPAYQRQLRDWHVVVADFLGTVRPDNADEFGAWKLRTRAYLAERKHPEQILENYCYALERHGEFVRRYGRVYASIEEEITAP